MVIKEEQRPSRDGMRQRKYCITIINNHFLDAALLTDNTVNREFPALLKSKLLYPWHEHRPVAEFSHTGFPLKTAISSAGLFCSVPDIHVLDVTFLHVAIGTGIHSIHKILSDSLQTGNFRCCREYFHSAPLTFTYIHPPSNCLSSIEN